jgi:hypothetical protein
LEQSDVDHVWMGRTVSCSHLVVFLFPVQPLDDDAVRRVSIRGQRRRRRGEHVQKARARERPLERRKVETTRNSVEEPEPMADSGQTIPSRKILVCRAHRD